MLSRGSHLTFQQTEFHENYDLQLISQISSEGTTDNELSLYKCWLNDK